MQGSVINVAPCSRQRRLCNRHCTSADLQTVPGFPCGRWQVMNWVIWGSGWNCGQTSDCDMLSACQVLVHTPETKSPNSRVVDRDVAPTAGQHAISPEGSHLPGQKLGRHPPAAAPRRPAHRSSAAPPGRLQPLPSAGVPPGCQNVRFFAPHPPSSDPPPLEKQET